MSMRVFADFYRHVETVALKMSHSGPNDKSFYFSRCSVVLNEAFGPSGYKVAFEFVRTGKDGGLYRVLKTVANLMAEAYAKNEICARVTYFLEGLTFDEKFAAQDEYLRQIRAPASPRMDRGKCPQAQDSVPQGLGRTPINDPSNEANRQIVFTFSPPNLKWGSLSPASGVKSLKNGRKERSHVCGKSPHSTGETPPFSDQGGGRPAKGGEQGLLSRDRLPSGGLGAPLPPHLPFA
jgi:hypothetical protein